MKNKKFVSLTLKPKLVSAICTSFINFGFNLSHAATELKCAETLGIRFRTATLEKSGENKDWIIFFNDDPAKVLTNPYMYYYGYNDNNPLTIFDPIAKKAYSIPRDNGRSSPNRLDKEVGEVFRFPGENTPYAILYPKVSRNY